MSEHEDNTPSRSEVALVGRAVRQRWNIPDSLREDVVRDLVVTATTAESDRDRVGAAKVLAAMDKLNLEQERRDELGTAADVKKLEHSGAVTLDVTTLTDEQLARLAAGQQ